MTPAPKMAGTTVIANGFSPGNTPKYRPRPPTTSDPMKIAYRTAMNAIMRQATMRGSSPDRRSAQAVSAMPPAPAEAKGAWRRRPLADLVAGAPVDPGVVATNTPRNSTT